MDDHELLVKIIEELQGVKSKVSSIDERLFKVDERLSNVEERLSDVDERLSNVEERLSDVSERLSNVEEDTRITRSAVNDLLEWADDASVQAVSLLKKESLING